MRARLPRLRDQPHLGLGDAHVAPGGRPGAAARHRRRRCCCADRRGPRERSPTCTALAPADRRLPARCSARRPRCTSPATWVRAAPTSSRPGRTIWSRYRTGGSASARVPAWPSRGRRVARGTARAGRGAAARRVRPVPAGPRPRADRPGQGACTRRCGRCSAVPARCFVDGEVAGTWRPKASGTKLTVAVEAFVAAAAGERGRRSRPRPSASPPSVDCPRPVTGLKLHPLGAVRAQNGLGTSSSTLRSAAVPRWPSVGRRSRPRAASR